MSEVAGSIELAQAHGPIATAVYVKYHSVDPTAYASAVARLEDLGVQHIKFDKATCDAILIGCGVPLDIRKALLSTPSLFKFILTPEFRIPDDIKVYALLQREVSSRPMNTIVVEGAKKGSTTKTQYLGTFAYGKRSNLSEIVKIMEKEPDGDGTWWCSVSFNPIIFNPKDSQHGPVYDKLRQKIIRPSTINSENIATWMKVTKDDILHHLGLDFLQKYCLAGALGIGTNRKNMVRNLDFKFNAGSPSADNYWNQFELTLCIGGPIYLAKTNPSPTETTFKVLLDSEIYLSCVSRMNDVVLYPANHPSYPKESQIYKKNTDTVIENTVIVARFLFFLPEVTFKAFARTLEIMYRTKLHSFTRGIEVAGVNLSTFTNPVFEDSVYQSVFGHGGTHVQSSLRPLMPAQQAAVQSPKRQRGVGSPSTSSSSSSSSSSTLLSYSPTTLSSSSTFFPFLTDSSSGSTPFFVAPPLYSTPSLIVPKPVAQMSSVEVRDVPTTDAPPSWSVSGAPDVTVDPQSIDLFDLNFEDASHQNDLYKRVPSPSKSNTSPDPFAFSAQSLLLPKE